MSDIEQASIIKDKERHNRKQETLWQELQIDFRLQSYGFPDNKIYGTITVIPESSRKLIEKFILVVNKTNRVEFNRQYVTIAASGLNTKREYPEAYVEAIPMNGDWPGGPKRSKTHRFRFTGLVFTLSPNITFEWHEDPENPDAYLIIEWYHLGDNNAQKYILYLDNLDIQYIRQKQIRDAFRVKIGKFKPGERHTLELVAQLNNGRETYRSDLMQFTVPSRETQEDTEFITVVNEPAPHNLQIFRPSEKDEEEEEEQQQQQSTPEIPSIPEEKVQRANIPTSKCCANRKHTPHDTFPGIEHYFMDSTNTWEEESKPVPSMKKKKTISFKKDIDGDDDDNDVMMGNDFQ
ncbi:unnamed protein product [Adineta ricciae]|uniref:Uncharacterized protein n=1 Tax=Adineta ricciae TaxID=249248 RepID=A0A813V2F1_ADIRI|nr:unnamed protein product [Adineta ricciae]CAF1267550.1 unnamed protein product [Adineta ricciae]